MKKVLLVLLGLIIVAVAGGGFLIWQATKGAPPDALQEKYMTSADRFVDVAGARVRVREEGAPDAPPILLIHGFTHSLETWDGWADALKSQFRVIRYDLLGHGLTGPDAQLRYAPRERAAFIGDLLDALRVKQAVIAGNSLGGLAAWRFASEQPDRVRALILVSPGAFPLNGVSDKPADIPNAMKVYLLTAPEAGVRASAELIYADDSKITDERVTVMRDMIRHAGNGRALIQSLEEFTLPDPSDALARVAAPTLIQWGEGDILISIEQGRQMETIIPDARLISYPDVGHAAQEEAPETTVADVIEFLNAQAPGADATENR